VPPPADHWLRRDLAGSVACTVKPPTRIDQQVPAASFGWCRRPCNPVLGIPARPPWPRSLSLARTARQAPGSTPIGPQKVMRRVWPAGDRRSRCPGCVSPAMALEVLDAMGLIVAEYPEDQHRPRLRASSSGANPLVVGAEAGSRPAAASICRGRCDSRLRPAQRTTLGESRCRGDQVVHPAGHSGVAGSIRPAADAIGIPEDPRAWRDALNPLLSKAKILAFKQGKAAWVRCGSWCRPCRRETA